MKEKPEGNLRDWHCWCCNTWFHTDWVRFKKHIDECELKVVTNPEVYDEKEM
jgi:hypothetical protein